MLNVRGASERKGANDRRGSMMPANPSLPAKVGPLWRDPVIWLALGLAFISGGLITVIPATFPIFKRAFSSNLEQLGRIAFMYYLSAILFCLVGGWVVRYLGQRRALASVLSLIAGALILIGSAPGYASILLGAFCLGLGGFSITVIISTIITEDYSSIRQSFFSLQWMTGSAGGVAVPAALGWWFIHSDRLGGDWRFAYFAIAIIMAAVIPFPLMLRFGPPSIRSTQAASGTDGLADIKHLLRQPAMYCLGVLNLLHGISNGGMVFFVGQLYQKKLGVDAADAAYFLSAGTIGFLVGRLLLSWITLRWRIPEMAVLGACAAVETLSYAGAIASPSYLLGVLAYGLAGIFGSGDAPSLSSYAGARFSTRAVSAFSLLGALSFVGGGAGSYIVGFFGKHLGVEVSIWLMPVFGLAMSLIAFEWFRRNRKQSSVPE